MQASWCYRCAEALCWCSVGIGERMQASWCYRGAEAVRWCSVGAAWERMQQASWFY